MTKTSITIAALAGLLLAGSAAPSFAESLAACQPDRSWDMADSNNNSLDSDAGIVASRLRAEGIKATSVEDWNGCYRAFVTTSDGGQKMEFFDPQTLQRVG